MSFENVTLPSFLIADLYKNNLVEDPDQAKRAPETIAVPVQPEKPGEIPATQLEKPALPIPVAPDKPLQFLGKNLRNFVIIVNYRDQIYMPDTQLEFLGNILKACQLNLGDVAIINYFNQMVNLENLVSLSPKYILVFGIGPMDPQLKTAAHFQVANYQNIQIVNAPAFELLNQNSPEGKVLKGNLWNCLKQLLGI